MIIIKLQGGLGNQMFQYAFGRSLSLRHNVSLKMDSSYLRTANQSGREFRLGGFNISVTEATSKEINRYCGMFQKICDKFKTENQKKRIVEKPSSFDQNVFERKDGYFDGYWNNEKYFKNIAEIIRKDFTLKNPIGKMAESIAGKIRSEANSVSVHIRRGDYVTIKKIAESHGTLPLSYYENAMKKIIGQFPNAHFFISSDDISWVKENFPKNYPLTFVSSPEIPDYEELILMSLCRHNIIANSTLSWWGAWLNQNHEKIVIAPKQWFIDPARVAKDLIPQSWVQI